MTSKYLEKKINLLTNEELKDVNSPFELEYYLVESPSTDIEEMEGKTVYGIEIVKRDTKGVIESELVRNYSYCKESTREMLSKLAAHTVNPVSLAYILDDLVGV